MVGQGGQGGQGGPGVPHSQCQGAPEVQVGQAGPERSLPWDPGCLGSPGAREGRAGWSRRALRSRRARHAPLSALRPRGPPSGPSSQPPAGKGRAGTGLGVRVGPPLLCPPLVPKGPGNLAIPEVPAGLSPRMHCCHTLASRAVLEVLEALGGQAGPAPQSRCWLLRAPPSRPSVRSPRGGPAVLESQCPPCALAVHRDPGVHGSRALPWCPSGQGPVLCRRGRRPCLALPSRPWVLGGPAGLWSPGHPLARLDPGSPRSQVCPQVLGQRLQLRPVPTRRRLALGAPGVRGGQDVPLRPCPGLPSLLGCLCLLSGPALPQRPLCPEGRGTRGRLQHPSLPWPPASPLDQGPPWLRAGRPPPASCLHLVMLPRAFQNLPCHQNLQPALGLGGRGGREALGGQLGPGLLPSRFSQERPWGRNPPCFPWVLGRLPRPGCPSRQWDLAGRLFLGDLGVPGGQGARGIHSCPVPREDLQVQGPPSC